MVYGSVARSDREIAILSRSMLEVIIELALYVDVPENHLSVGRTYESFLDQVDVSGEFGPLISIASDKSKPVDDFIAVRYKDHWFWKAVTTQLVAHADLHPALIDVLLLAAEEIHGTGGVFEDVGEFPAPKQLDFRLSKETQRFYKSGPTFLRRYLPFWLATFVDRMKILLLPLVALLFPFFKVMPSLYHWRMRSRIYRWYRELGELDPEIQREKTSARREEDIERLNQIESQVSHISVPLAYREELYHLRLHIDMLRKKLLDASARERGSG